MRTPSWSFLSRAALVGILALGAPAALSAAMTRELTRPITPGSMPCPATVTLDARVARQGSAAVVIVGNSTANQAVQGARLGKVTGRPNRVLKASLPNASPLTWYAVLAHRVFGRGLRPELVVVAAPSGAFWQTTPTQSLDVRELLEIAGTADPVVRRFLGADGASSTLRTASLRRESLRAAAIGAVTRLPLLGLGPDVQDNVLNAFVVEAAGPRPRDATVVRRALLGPLDRPTAPNPAPDVQETLLPELAALAARHGSSIVFAETPSRIAPEDSEARGAALAAWAEGVGSAYLRVDPGLVDEDYADNWHLTDAAALAYTDALGRAVSPWLGPVGRDPVGRRGRGMRTLSPLAGR